MKTLTILLSSQQIATLQAAVETGQYASNSDVVRDALLLWERREEVRRLDVAQLKHAYTEGMASGEGRPLKAAALLKDLKSGTGKRG